MICLISLRWLEKTVPFNLDLKPVLLLPPSLPLPIIHLLTLEIVLAVSLFRVGQGKLKRYCYAAL